MGRKRLPCSNQELSAEALASTVSTRMDMHSAS
jgi:hypothetical protein